MKFLKNLKKIPFKNTIFVLLFVNLLLIIFIVFAQRFLPPVVPLFYGQPQGREQLAKSIFLVIPPLIAIIIVAINTSIIFFTQNKFLQKVLLCLAIMTTILSTIADIKIIFLVGSL